MSRVEVLNQAVAILRLHPVMSVESFEQVLTNIVSKSHLVGSGGVQSDLIESGRIRYMDIKGVRHILYLPVIGQIQDTPCVSLTDLTHILDELAPLIK